MMKKINSMFVVTFTFFLIILMSSAFASEPLPWQMGLQPPAGSIAEMADDLHNLLLIVITAISVFVLGLMVYVCFRFREQKNPVPSKTTHNSILEVMWTVIPVLILIIIAIPSFKLLYYLDEQREADLTIKVTGNQWYWNYEYMDEEMSFDSYMIADEDLKPGQKRMLDVDNPLVVPVGSKIKVLITGNDVMHSFFIPSLAVQEYSFPGRINEVWMEVPKEEKTYYGQCNQICGINHAYMPVVVKSLSIEKYNKWLIEARKEFAFFPLNKIENIKLAQVNN